MKSANVILPILGLIILFCLTLHVEGSNGYSYADCTYVKGEHDSKHYGGRCFCYSSGTVIKWRDIWSTFQVRLTSDEDVYIVYPMEARNCHDPDNLLTLTKCLVEHYWPSSVQRERTLDIPLVEEDVCFMVKTPRASVEYTLRVTGKRLNRMRFALFTCGLTLFYFAGAICRSPLFFYTSGISLGIVSILVLLLFILKSFVPKRGIFLMLFGAGSSLSYLGIQKVMTDWDEMITLYWREVLGYLLVSGLISFAVCYKHGPITSKHTLTLMTWGMQASAMALLYYGVAFPPAAYTLLGALLGLKLLPLALGLLLGTCRQTARLFSCFLGLFWRRCPKVRLLMEEEYREQGEVHTRASLEELREHCSKPGFPAWDTVLKLSSPQRFADFLRGGSHVAPSELQSHKVQYGLGGAYYEDLLLSGGPARAAPPGAGEDVSEDELDSYAQGPPTPNPLPSYPTVPNLPTYITPMCPYPPAPYSSYPEPQHTEDLELF